MDAEDLVVKAQGAIRFLAGRCDWARTQDGKGFSGIDAPLGHALAEKNVWSARETEVAAGFIVKYKKQLKEGAVNTQGVESLIPCGAALAPRLKKRDIVNGLITVDEAKQKLVIKTGYNANLVSLIREMTDACWNSATNIWTAGLSLENSEIVETIATEFGIELQKHDGWDALKSGRSVKVNGGHLFVHGVNAWKIINSMPRASGNPDADEKNFGAMQRVDETTISIPLRSWNIRSASLWLTTLKDGHRLAWARKPMLAALGKAYPKALDTENENSRMAAALALPPAQMQNAIPSSIAERLMPHQFVGIHALLQQRQIILADQQGLGKTIEILAALEVAQAFPAIVLAPATALLTWRDEANTWLPQRKVSVLGGGVGKKDSGAPLTRAEIIILNYESFSKYSEVLAQLGPVALVADEAQYLKGYDSARTKAVKEFCHKTTTIGKTGRIIAATGTPVMNRPSEMLTMLTLLPDLLNAMGGFGYFAARYCRATLHETDWTAWWDYDGAANLDEVALRIRASGGLIRREKSDVLKTLPAKKYERVEVDVSNRDEYEEARDNFSDWLKTHNSTNEVKRDKKAERCKMENRENEDDSFSVMMEAAWWAGYDDFLLDNADDRHEALKQVGVLRRLAGEGKADAVVTWALSDAVKDEKLVIFAYHKDVQKKILDGLLAHEANVLTIVGDQSASARAKAIRLFQTDPLARIIVCSLKAAQTAITLTAARMALLVEYDWTPAGLEQAEDRIHRIGQNRQVVITTLHAIDTLDDRMQTILNRKSGIVKGLNNASPHGQKKDGSPRRQVAGPGRPRLSPEERAIRRRATKAVWQARNLEYMREYMRERRKTKVG
jgi:superfamily II DNA or RNA helicase